jgi:hypothetical protein
MSDIPVFGEGYSEETQTGKQSTTPVSSVERKLDSEETQTGKQSTAPVSSVERKLDASLEVLSTTFPKMDVQRYGTGKPVRKIIRGRVIQ